jgi:hypothetical protein
MPLEQQNRRKQKKLECPFSLLRLSLSAASLSYCATQHGKLKRRREKALCEERSRAAALARRRSEQSASMAVERAKFTNG